MKNIFFKEFNSFKSIFSLQENSKLVVILLLFMLYGNTQSIYAQLFGDFPYQQNFTNTTQPPEIILPTGAGTNATVFTTTGVELTPAQNNKFGAIIIDNKTFNSSVGIKISFEYAIYGGSGADGMTVFLFDAAVAPVIGSKGAGLGYSYLRTNNTYSTTRKEGLAGAYLGIGLDAYGGFKSNKFLADKRYNGIATPGGGGWAPSGNGSSHVTLRGARGGFLDANGKAAGFTGYPVLITQSTIAPLVSSNGGAVLTTAGGYTFGGGIADNFNLRSNVYTTDSTNAGYRKVFIDLIPNAGGGYNITIKIQHQNVLTTVISNYWYQTSITYTENANPASTDFNLFNTQGTNTTHVLSTAVPSAFKIGFSAGTGALNDIHKLWKLNVALPYAAEAADDNVITCKNVSVSINPYINDIAYSGVISGTPTASSSNIDFDEFQFLNDDETVASTPFLVTTSQGTFTYNATTGLVDFMPKPGFSGTASVSYKIKGRNNGVNQPYGDEGFRSSLATIYVNVKKCQVITNPMLPPKSNVKY